MKRNWELDELIEHFTILPNEMKLIENKTGEPELYAQYDWTGRSITYHRTQIREFFGYREDVLEDAREFTDWLCRDILYQDHDFEHIQAHVYRRFREFKIVPPSPDRIERLIRSAIHTYEESFFQATFQNLPSSTLTQLDSLIESISYIEANDEEVSSDSDEQISFNALNAVSYMSNHNTIHAGGIPQTGYITKGYHWLLSRFFRCYPLDPAPSSH